MEVIQEKEDSFARIKRSMKSLRDERSKSSRQESMKGNFVTSGLNSFSCLVTYECYLSTKYSLLVVDEQLKMKFLPN